jgi:hypothetical protein
VIGKATPTGAGFKGLVSYLMRGKTAEPDPDRVAWSETRNLLVDDPDLAVRIMRNSANRSLRVEKPVYHVVLSWHKDENPTRELMRAVADTTMSDLRLSEHQQILIAHHDTDHRHLHIVVNRVHPERHTAWKKSHDYRTIEVSIGRQSKALGMRYVPGRHNEPETFRKTAKKPRNSEVQRAERLGTKDQLRGHWTPEQIAEKRPRLAETIAAVRSWDELDRALSADGLDISAKGQGLVVGDATGIMKLSELRQNIRLKGLEHRFGESFGDFDKRREETRRLQEMNREQRIAERERQLAQRAPTKVEEPADGSAQDETPAPSATSAAPAVVPDTQPEPATKIPMVPDTNDTELAPDPLVQPHDDKTETTPAAAAPTQPAMAATHTRPHPAAKPQSSTGAVDTDVGPGSPMRDGDAKQDTSRASAPKTERQRDPVRSRIVQIFDIAHSWDDLNRALTAEGLRLVAKGQGLVLGDTAGPITFAHVGKSVEALETRYNERLAMFAIRLDHERRLQDMSRQQRVEQLAREQALRAPPKGSAPTETTSAQDEPVSQGNSSPTPSKERTVSRDPEVKLQENVGKAYAEADLAKTLHEGGLVTKAQLRRAKDALEQARQELDTKKTLKERFQRELVEVLTPKMPEPPPRPTNAEEPETTRPVKDKRKDKERDRER